MDYRGTVTEGHLDRKLKDHFKYPACPVQSFVEFPCKVVSVHVNIHVEIVGIDSMQCATEKFLRRTCTDINTCIYNLRKGSRLTAARVEYSTESYVYIKVSRIGY
jgi:hypothetical protein